MIQIFLKILLLFDKNTLTITVEFPIIEDIVFKGIKANKIKDEINNNINLKQDLLLTKLFLLKIKNQFYRL